MGIETYAAFVGDRQIAAGDLHEVVGSLDSRPEEAVVVLHDASGQTVELDLRRGAAHAIAEYEARHAPPEPAPRRGRGRPRLGVVAREVTLLGRHWDWLSTQPGGASATLRRLVEDARRSAPARARRAREALYRAMSTLAGDRLGFEDAARALFASDDAGFDRLVAAWPADIAAYVMRLASVEREARGNC